MPFNHDARAVDSTSALLALPVEIFRQILAEAAHVRGIKRALRLRLVSKFFQTELAEALIVCKLANQCNLVEWQRIPFFKPYFERCLIEDRTRYRPGLRAIRKIAESLAADEGDINSVGRYCVNLLAMAWKSPQSRLMCSSDCYGADENFACDLIAAAAFTNHAGLFKSLVTKWKDLTQPIGYLGCPFWAALHGNDQEILQFIIEEAPHLGECGPVSTTDILHTFVSGRNSGREVEMFLNSEVLNPFKSYERLVLPMSGYGKRRLDLTLMTPSVEIFNIILAERARVGMKPLDQLREFGFLSDLLYRHVRKGWPETARHLLSLGASPEIRIGSREPKCSLHLACKLGHAEVVKVLLDYGTTIRGTELLEASTHGHAEIVEMLLHSGADVHCEGARDSLSAAARGGFFGIVRTLLNAGMDVNEGSPPPIFSAMEAEHEGIVQVLKERGAIPVQGPLKF